VIKGGTIVKRNLFGIGALVLGLATLMWSTAALSAPHGGGAPAGGGGHAAAHVGSVHYAAAPAHAMAAPARAVAAPAVRSASVRSEHYAGSAVGGGGYRNPYSSAYFGHFRSGYSSYVLGGAQYYGYDSLPIGYQQVVLDGIIYYLFEGVYYQPYIYGGQTVYLVAPDQ
jgi:hypothetical protein